MQIPLSRTNPPNFFAEPGNGTGSSSKTILQINPKFV